MEHGEEAVVVAEHLVQVAESMDMAAVGTNEQMIAIYEQAKSMWDREHGAGHVLTARCLVGIGRRYASPAVAEYHRALEYGRGALAVVKKVGNVGGIEAVGALRLIGVAHFRLGQDDEALEHYERRLRLLLEYHGEGAKKVVEVANAYNCIGEVYCDGRGDFERALEYYMKAVPVAEEATGKSSETTGYLCESIAVAYEKQQRWAESVTWWEKALAAYTFTFGAENEQHTRNAKRYLEEAEREAAKGAEEEATYASTRSFDGGYARIA
jgi:tetratricopeptide (TPR) repeat protein